MYYYEGHSENNYASRKSCLQISFFFKPGLRYCFRYSLGCLMRFRHGLRMLSRFLPLLICFIVVSLCVSFISPIDLTRSSCVIFLPSLRCTVTRSDSSLIFTPFSQFWQGSVLQMSRGRKSFSTKSVYSQKLSRLRQCEEGRKVLERSLLDFSRRCLWLCMRFSSQIQSLSSLPFFSRQWMMLDMLSLSSCSLPFLRRNCYSLPLACYTSM